MPPFSVTPRWSAIRSITGWAASGSNSVELAPLSPQTFRANSTTASCMPRQMPKNGTACSRA